MSDETFYDGETVPTRGLPIEGEGLGVISCCRVDLFFEDCNKFGGFKEKRGTIYPGRIHLGWSVRK
jgi:hypothetical protein